MQKLEQNDYFHRLNILTKFHLVFEDLELKMFFPGQLIMSVHRRSPLCKEYMDFYKFGNNKFRKDVDNNMSKVGDPSETLFTALLAGINKGDKSPLLKEK